MAEQNEQSMIRIANTDIPGGMTLYSGLTKIKGVSWSLSNAICNSLNIDKNKKVYTLENNEIENLANFINQPQVPEFLLNRKKDLETGETKHLIRSNLDLRNSFDIKRLRNIKSYRGFRHTAKLPARGQRTKANFRKNKAKGSGIKKKK